MVLSRATWVLEWLGSLVLDHGFNFCPSSASSAFLIFSNCFGQWVDVHGEEGCMSGCWSSSISLGWMGSNIHSLMSSTHSPFLHWVRLGTHPPPGRAWKSWLVSSSARWKMGEGSALDGRWCGFECAVRAFVGGLIESTDKGWTESIEWLIDLRKTQGLTWPWRQIKYSSTNRYAQHL